MEFCSEKTLKGNSFLSELESEERKKGRNCRGPKVVDSNDREREELRYLPEGEMQEGSSIEYIPDSKEEEDIYGKLLLESEGTINGDMSKRYNVWAISSVEVDVRHYFSRGHGPSKRQSRNMPEPCIVWRQGKGNGQATEERNVSDFQVIVMDNLVVILQLQWIMKKLVRLNARMTTI